MNHSTKGADGIASELLFSTPIFKQSWPGDNELNGYLRELFLAREKAEPKSNREYSNVGGWHSPIDLHETWDPDLRSIIDRSHALAVTATSRLAGAAGSGRQSRFTQSAWANVSRQGDYNVPHVHMATWSAVYYVSVPADCGGEPPSGVLELMDPRPATAMLDMPGRFFATRHFIKPEPGLMVLFPASLMHFVHPFRGAGERISIACDLTLDPT